MVQLSFFEEVKDKASRLIPTPYMEIVEEATATNLHIPLYEHVMFLCESANTKPDAVDDIVRAIRRRISDDDPAVKHLTVLLLDAMIKNCGPEFHVEICAQKGLLRDLENIASNRPTSARGMQAKEAALTLVLNLSIWFAGHPDPNCHILTTIAGDVRARSGPNAFDSVRSDATVRIRMSSGANRNRSRSESKPDPRYRDPRSAAGPAVVDAIPVNLPKEDDIAQMLDTCVTFSEYVQNADLLEDGTVRPDDVIVGFEEKVRRDHAYVQLILSSDLPVDREVLKSIRDSQNAVLRSLAVPRGDPQISSPNAPEAGIPASFSPTRTAEATDAVPAASPPPPSTPPKAATQDSESPAPAKPADAPHNAAPAVDMDDLFGPPSTAEAAAPAAQAQDDFFGSGPSAAAPADVTANEEGAVEAAEPSVSVDDVKPEEDESAYHDERAAGSSHAENPTEGDKEAPASEAAVPAEPARAASAANPVDDDDFDAFLEGRLSKS